MHVILGCTGIKATARGTYKKTESAYTGMQWRYIPFQRYDPFLKLGLNDAAMQAVQNGGDPRIWLVGWAENCINVGRGQTVADEVDMAEAERRDVTIVRRQGGGGTTYLTTEGEVTWQVVAPATMFPEDVNQIYEQVCGWIVDAAAQLGIDAWHEPVNDVVTDSGKISGATCKQQDGAVYVAGTLLYDVDVKEMFSLLTPGDDKLQDKVIDRFEDRVSTVSQESDALFEETRQALRDALTAGKNVTTSRWTESEMETAKKLADKYRSDEWIYQQ